MRDGADFALLGKVVLSGIAVLAFLFWRGLMGSAQALGVGTLIQSTQ
jgi:hypothetical protein